RASHCRRRLPCSRATLKRKTRPDFSFEERHARRTPRVLDSINYCRFPAPSPIEPPPMLPPPREPSPAAPPLAPPSDGTSAFGALPVVLPRTRAPPWTPLPVVVDRERISPPVLVAPDRVSTPVLADPERV